MQVSHIVSIRVKILVKDRIPYDLHNTGAIMIMQMKVKQECSANEERRKITRNCMRPGNNRKGETRLRGVFGSDQKVNTDRDSDQTDTARTLQNKTKTGQINKQTYANNRP